MKFIELKKKVEEVPELATLPGVTAELLSILQSKNVPIDYITAIIETDPTLTIKILRSLHYSGEKSAEKIDSVFEAIKHLGIDEVRTILFHFTVYSKLFRFKPEQQHWMHRYWIHSVACAHLCRLLANRFGIHTDNREFTAGLLHDIGKLYLIQFLPDQCKQIQDSITQTSMNDLDAENKILGATHTMIGGWLADKWHLPPVHTEIIKHHHDPRMAAYNQPLTALVNFAETCCVKIGYGFLEGRFPLPVDHSRGWAILESINPGIQNMDETTLLSELTVELESQQGFIGLIRGENLFPTFRSEHTMNIDVLRARIDAVQELDSLPPTTTRLFAFLNDPNVSLGELCAVAKSDSVLNDIVLRVINSSFYDFPDHIHTVQQAAGLLGLTEFTHLLVTISLISKLYNGEKAQRSPKIEAYWDHAIGSGMVSNFLVLQLSLPTRGREFTAGILHDIGKLALLEHFTAAADVIDRRIQSEQCSDIQSELAIVGVPHTEIGGWIAEKWNLPASYIEVIRYHHVPEQALGNTLLASIIHIADGILQIRGVGLIEESVQIDVNMIERWQALARVHPPAKDIDPMHLINEIPFSLADTRNFLSLISERNSGNREA